MLCDAGRIRAADSGNITASPQVAHNILLRRIEAEVNKEHLDVYGLARDCIVENYRNVAVGEGARPSLSLVGIAEEALSRDPQGVVVDLQDFLVHQDGLLVVGEVINVRGDE